MHVRVSVSVGVGCGRVRVRALVLLAAAKYLVLCASVFFCAICNLYLNRLGPLVVPQATYE